MSVSNRGWTGSGPTRTGGPVHFGAAMISLSSANLAQPFAREARQAVGRFNHFAFAAADRADVDRFYQDVLAPLAKAGLAEIEDPPVDCPEYAVGYYATFFFDPDGIKYEVVFTP
jgi:catechol 2,3-dioxygenase-like lactoylglutathione lyase family enzyme